MKIAIKQPGRKIDARDVQAVEDKLRGTFPDDFREFLLKFNGGKPETNRCEIPQTKTGCSVTLFFGILGEDEPGDLRHEQKRFKGRLPDRMIAIAHAEGGNLVCLSLHSRDHGAVYFWDHELESSTDLRAAISDLASSFGAFLARLETFDIQQIEIKPGQVQKAWIDPDFLKSLKEKE